MDTPTVLGLFCLGKSQILINFDQELFKLYISLYISLGHYICIDRFEIASEVVIIL